MIGETVKTTGTIALMVQSRRDILAEPTPSSISPQFPKNLNRNFCLLTNLFNCVSLLRISSPSVGTNRVATHHGGKMMRVIPK